MLAVSIVFTLKTPGTGGSTWFGSLYDPPLIDIKGANNQAYLVFGAPEPQPLALFALGALALAYRRFAARHRRGEVPGGQAAPHG